MYRGFMNEVLFMCWWLMCQGFVNLLKFCKSVEISMC